MHHAIPCNHYRCNISTSIDTCLYCAAPIIIPFPTICVCGKSSAFYSLFFGIGKKNGNIAPQQLHSISTTKNEFPHFIHSMHIHICIKFKRVFITALHCKHSESLLCNTNIQHATDKFFFIKFSFFFLFRLHVRLCMSVTITCKISQRKSILILHFLWLCNSIVFR